jgi:hypothetical protein
VADAPNKCEFEEVPHGCTMRDSPPVRDALAATLVSPVKRRERFLRPS